MLSLLKTFCADEEGAVTVDWVVLTAAVVGLGVGVILVIQVGALNWANDVSGSLSAAEVAEIGVANGD